jgi:ribonuclease BN (tRNA processing enzyme)
VRVTVLGGCGAWPEAGRAASGFLVEHDGFRIVLDLGYATLPRLLSHCPGGAVDAVVITHEHPDHCVDLSALLRVRVFGGGERIPLYCPPGVLERVGGLEARTRLTDAFVHHGLPGEYRVGPFTLTGVPLPHHVPNAGVRLATADRVLAYTGDTGPDPALSTLGAGADLYIVEATTQGGPPAGPRLDLTAAEAGAWAARAGAKRLMLTHFWPGSDRAVSVAQAAGEFPGEILVADEGFTVDV